MKKITFSILLFLAMVSGTYSQVQIGEGTNEGQSVPFEPYFIFSYAQSIYLANEINASGSITAIKWYYSGTTALPNSQQLVVYMGHTEKDVYYNSTDFVDPAALIQVYSGGITIPVAGTPGWATITLDEPFLYNGTSNLVIAVDENKPGPGYDATSDDFHNTATEVARSIWANSDVLNIDSTDPANNFTTNPLLITRAISSFVPNIILGGIQQACANPTALGVDNLTNVSANLKWAVNPDIATYNVEYGESGFQPGSGIATATGVGNPHPISDLIPQTAYQFYVQSSCGSSTSTWSGPYSFSTACDPMTGFSENFDEAATLPECWSKIVDTANPNAYVNVVNNASFSPANHLELYNSGDTAAKLYIVSPSVTTFEDMRLKFRAYGSADYTLEVGTMTNPSDPASFTIVGTPITLTDSYAEYSRILDGSAGNYIAIRHGLGGTYRTIHVDNMLFEAIPTVVPECATDANVTANENCGNYASLFQWGAVPGADGYRLSIGTTSGGSETLNNADLGNITSYSFAGNYNTTYYYSLVAYNVIGDAVGCTINSFSTAADGCYCESAPGETFGNGITNVKIGLTDFPIEFVTYSDNTLIDAVDLPQNVTANVQITFETGSPYNAHIWVDFNDNYTFDSDEKVFTGVSASGSPAVLNASFPVPANAALGNHRIRIGTADIYTGQSTPDPCYNSWYGITLDFTVNIIPPPSCLPPTDLSASTVLSDTATLAWSSEATSFSIQYGEGTFSPGEGTVVENITAASYDLSMLSANTAYQFYVQTDCGAGSLSPWAGPYSFTTACGAFGDFEEDFTVDTGVNAPTCWTVLIESTSPSAAVEVDAWSDILQMYNGSDTGANVMLITPILTDLPNGTHRIKFKATTYASNATLIVGTMSDPTDASTFTAVQTVDLPNNGSYSDFSVPFASSANNYVAFKHGLGTASMTLYVDDVVWEAVPQVVPDCIQDVDITINENCGTFATLFEWEAVENADGYKVSVGTADGGTDLVNSQNIGSATSFNFTGDFDTTYYYTVTPFNEIGDAAGCFGGTFTTAPTGCYCTSMPTSNDGLGITNIQLGEVDFIIGDVFYLNNSGQEAVAFNQNTEANLQITFFTDGNFGNGTSYTYDSHVWIDFNDNYVFEASEKVFTGMSLAASPTTLDASFMVPAGAALGNHRMRIGTADSGQETPNPCYSGGYGVTVDFTVAIEEELSVGNFDSSNFKVYPNPVSDILNLSYTQNITNVAVFNILGQEVLTDNMDATKGQVDMSDLAVGTYLVKVTAGGQTKTIKVLKK